jgi:hypothetical protein
VAERGGLEIVGARGSATFLATDDEDLGGGRPAGRSLQGLEEGFAVDIAAIAVEASDEDPELRPRCDGFVAGVADKGADWRGALAQLRDGGVTSRVGLNHLDDADAGPPEGAPAEVGVGVGIAEHRVHRADADAVRVAHIDPYALWTAVIGDDLAEAVAEMVAGRDGADLERLVAAGRVDPQREEIEGVGGNLDDLGHADRDELTNAICVGEERHQPAWFVAVAGGGSHAEALGPRPGVSADALGTQHPMRWRVGWRGLARLGGVARTAEHAHDRHAK